MPNDVQGVLGPGGQLQDKLGNLATADSESKLSLKAYFNSGFCLCQISRNENIRSKFIIRLLPWTIEWSQQPRLAVRWTEGSRRNAKERRRFPLSSSAFHLLPPPRPVLPSPDLPELQRTITFSKIICARKVYARTIRKKAKCHCGNLTQRVTQWYCLLLVDLCTSALQTFASIATKRRDLAAGAGSSSDGQAFF